MSKGRKTVTIKDVAKAANVSPSTVSVVLNDYGDKYRISKTTQAKVLSVARALQFKPGAFTRRVNGGNAVENPIICVFWEAHFYHGPLKEFFEGLLRYKNESGLNLEFAVHPYEGGNLASMKRVIDLGIYHGIIVTGLDEKDEEFIMSVVTDVPIVIFNRDVSGLSAVYIDNYSVGQRAASCLINTNAVSLACVNPLIMHKNPGIRQAGFYDTCVRNGIPYEAIFTLHEENTSDGGRAAAAKVVENMKTPLGVFVSGDTMIAGFVDYFRYKGLSIPGDAFIVAYGNDAICEVLTPSITCICPPTADMGYDCIQMIDSLMKGLNGRGNVKKHECTMNYRESCPHPQ